jgi:hypothetical protein
MMTTEQTSRPQRSVLRMFLVRFSSMMGIVVAITGLEFADHHEPSLANALAGRQLYSDAGTIRILSIVLLVLCIAALVREFIRR